jgi:hypothetical protein
VAENDRLTVNRNFCQIVEPKKILLQFARLLVVISGHGKDLLTADPATVCDNACVASHTEVAQKVMDNQENRTDAFKIPRLLRFQTSITPAIRCCPDLVMEDAVTFGSCHVSSAIVLL